MTATFLDAIGAMLYRGINVAAGRYSWTATRARSTGGDTPTILETGSVAAELVSDPLWSAHLEYVRVIRRTGRGGLARNGMETTT